MQISFVVCYVEVHRERTFFIATKEDFQVPAWLSLLTAEQAETEAHEVWNRNARPKVQDWLNVSQTPHDRARLRSMGNVVYPRQARLAMHWILRQIN